MLRMKHNKTIKLEIDVGTNLNMTNERFNVKIAEAIYRIEIFANSSNDLRFHIKWKNEDEFIIDNPEEK